MSPTPPSISKHARPLKDSDYAALGAFRRAIREFLAFSEDGAEAQGLTSQQHQALLAIRSHQGPSAFSIRDLAESLLIKHHSAIGLLERLVEKGLVTRRPSLEDRRRVLIELAPNGADALEAISVRNLRQLGRTAEILTQILRTAESLEAS